MIEPHRFVIGAILFIFMLTAGIAVMYTSDGDGLFDKYGIEKEDSLKTIETASLNSTRAQQLENKTKEQYDLLQNNPVEKSTGIIAVLAGSYNVVQQLGAYFDVANGVMTDVTHLMGIPDFIVYFFYTLILVAILWSIIYMIFRLLPRG